MPLNMDDIERRLDSIGQMRRELGDRHYAEHGLAWMVKAGWVSREEEMGIRWGRLHREKWLSQEWNIWP